MSKLATMGTSSCATIAVQGFGTGDFKEEKAYQNTNGMSVQGFYNEVLYPTTQDLGRTCDYPFSALMEAIDRSSMESKFMIATLNSYQYQQDDKFWPKLLESFGFQLNDKTYNSIGSMCYIFIRNNNRPLDLTDVQPITPGTYGSPDHDEEDDYDEDDDFFDSYEEGDS